MENISLPVKGITIQEVCDVENVRVWLNEPWSLSIAQLFPVEYKILLFRSSI
ncbi:hypothetical protein PILCRDRAFT_824535 [Piloderma croceum F 1598]|uniref:Uncharacterized protein n=1 Tax=Piloderma croceum (strain F 1598) TaxID=765440 RepID=A0A0C3BLX3_PILCF|nr:hypothetical protein PILCRDRAFT_824535 [Piloderma croceum F 1598]